MKKKTSYYISTSEESHLRHHELFSGSILFKSEFSFSLSFSSRVVRLLVPFLFIHMYEVYL